MKGEEKEGQRARTPIIFFTMGRPSTKCTLVTSGTNYCGPDKVICALDMSEENEICIVTVDMPVCYIQHLPLKVWERRYRSMYSCH
jgi:hypothetical protein